MSSECRVASSRRGRLVALILAAALACVGCNDAGAAKPALALTYDVDFAGHARPSAGVIDASITVRQPRSVLRELTFAVSGRLSLVSADGELIETDGSWRWQVPEQGGELRYRFTVDQPKGDAFDARVTPEWAVLRLGDLFPPARARSLKGASSVSRLALTSAEDGWSFETRYGSVDTDGVPLPVQRNFNRPTGWLMAGSIGVRRDRIAGVPVAIAAPVNGGYRRMDTLAFLRWTLPSLYEVFPPAPGDRLLIAGAPAGMWRGGLSGPGSLYVHADRPLVSENGTSTLLHELVHVASAWLAADDADWIVEGFAEYYAIEVLYRAGGLSERRRQRVYEMLQSWVESESGKLADPSSGADTAAAVLLLKELDARLDGRLDRVVAMLDHPELDQARLFDAVGRVGTAADLKWLRGQVSIRARSGAR